MDMVFVARITVFVVILADDAICTRAVSNKLGRKAIWVRQGLGWYAPVAYGFIHTGCLEAF